MNVIFLDIDGVLNTSETIDLYIKKINTTGLDEEKIKILSKIVKLYNCKIVISSSWKLYWDEEDDSTLSESLRTLFNLFKKYGIECIGKTPDIMKRYSSYSYNEMWKDYDIKTYLKSHPEIEHFCIIDDQTFDLTELIDYVVKANGKRLPNPSDEGLTEQHIEEIGMKLRLENRYK